MNRRGVTLLEILVGLAILGFCFAPLFEMLQGSRQVLSTSQEMLMLQNQAFQALSEARALVASGDLLDLDETEEEVLEAEEEGVRYSIVIRRQEADGPYLVTVRTSTDERYFQLVHAVANPLASFYRLDDEELPEPWEGEDHSHGGSL